LGKNDLGFTAVSSLRSYVPDLRCTTPVLSMEGSKPSQAKPKCELEAEAQVDGSLSVSHSCVWPHSWAQ